MKKKNQIPNPWENIFSQKYQSSPSSGKQRSVVHLKKLQMYSSWGHHVQIKSLLMGQPCNQILVGSLTPLGLSIDRCINILYCYSKFKALYMMGVDIFLYVEEGIKQLCKNFFFNLFSIYFLTSFHLVGSKSWDSFILLSMKVPIQISPFFFTGGGGLHRNRSHHGLLTVRSQTTGTLWYLYSNLGRKVGIPFPAL